LLLGLGCVLLLLCLGALVPVSIAASTADESCGVRGAWLLVAARREDAAVLALAAGLLPVAVYPVYALALEFSRINAAINPRTGSTSTVHVARPSWRWAKIISCQPSFFFTRRAKINYL
jgi:hypothetical protein